MASRFVENLEEVPMTHPHLNVSLHDILAEEKRKRSASHSSSASASSSSAASHRRAESDAAPSPTSPLGEGMMTAMRKRGFTLGGGSKKDRRGS